MRTAVFSVLLAALSGCSSSATSTPGDSGAASSAVREPWFCQTGADAEQWECVQSEALAANPQPTRKPPQPEPPAPPPRVAPEPVAAAPAEPPPAVVPAEPEPPRPTEADRPKHVRLSYKPDKPVSILDLPGDFWAVQLVALSSPEALEEYVARHKMRGMSAARVWNGEQLFYILLLGIYETRAIAEEAVTDLPPPFDRHAPWIRPLGSLQRAMVAADEVAAEAEES